MGMPAKQGKKDILIQFSLFLQPNDKVKTTEQMK